MTILQVLDRIAAELTPLGWPAFPRPTTETAHQRFIEVALGDARVSPASIDAPGLSVTILVALYTDLRRPDGYDELVAATEWALSRLASLTLFRDLEAQDVLIDVNAITADGPAPISQGPSGTGYWRALVRIPISRRRL